MKKLSNIRKIKLFGLGLSLIGFTLSWVFFGWELSLVLFLIVWGNNIDNNIDNKFRDI